MKNITIKPIIITVFVLLSMKVDFKLVDESVYSFFAAVSLVESLLQFVVDYTGDNIPACTFALPVYILAGTLLHPLFPIPYAWAIVRIAKGVPLH